MPLTGQAITWSSITGEQCTSSYPIMIRHINQIAWLDHYDGHKPGPPNGHFSYNIEYNVYNPLLGDSAIRGEWNSSRSVRRFGEDAALLWFNWAWNRGSELMSSLRNSDPSAARISTTNSQTSAIAKLKNRHRHCSCLSRLSHSKTSDCCVFGTD